MAYISIPTVSSYCATKAMVSNFTEALHYEVKDMIDVTLWEPGGIKTKIFTQGLDKGANPPPEW